MSKSTLYNEAKRRGLSPVWIGSTKQQLIELLAGVNENRSPTRAELYRRAKELGYDRPWRTSKIDKLERFIGRALNRQAIQRQNEDLIKLNEFLDNPEHQKILSIDDIAPNDVLNAIRSKPFNPNFHLIIANGYMHYTFNEQNIGRILKILNGIYVAEEEITGSDRQLSIDLINPNLSKKIYWISKERSRPVGGYFKYYNAMQKINLSRYGIYCNEFDASKDEENCLILALKNSNIQTDEINRIKTMIKTRYVPQKDIKIIAEELRVNIVVKAVETNKQKSYGPSGKRRIVICLIDQHYFLDEKTQYTTYSVKNYDKICHLENFNFIYNETKLPNGTSYYRYDENRTISSGDLIKLIWSLYNKDKVCLVPITLENCGRRSDFDVKALEYETLPEVNELDIKEVVNKDKEMKIDEVIYFDTETTTNGLIHEPYLICSHTRRDEKLGFSGDFCILNWLNAVSNIYDGKTLLCLAHNLRYDFQFVVRYLHSCSNLVKTGNRIKSVNGWFTNYQSKTKIKMIFKDSRSMIETSLKSFGSMFKLDQCKEVMPYSLYTRESVNGPKFVDIKSSLEYVAKSDHETFIDNIKKWGLMDETETKFNLIEYSRRYCEIDCSVLKAGYETFREWMMEVTSIDIDQMVSLPQLSNKFGLMNGVFDGCYKLSGVPRDFIQRCVVGGRVMTRRNEKFEINHQVDDFDGVSLYPSAMNRMDGLLKGIPKVWHSGIDLNKVDGYFLEINVNGLDKERDFPLLSRKNDAGIREFRNDIRGRGIYVDKVGLEDLVKFQGMTYTIIRGYYYDSGRNDKIKDFMKTLFEERAKKKKVKNPIETVYKLLMNAFYGKMIMKPIKHDHVFVKGKDRIDARLQYRFNSISEFSMLSDKLAVFKEARSINNHFSLPHCGVEILSMSKRIMNEVMCLAEDRSIDIYYQDTDSMHIDKRDNNIEKLSHAFRHEYGRELIGKKLGQFHSDFNFVSEDETPVSVNSIYLGKKTYYDHVKMVNYGKVSYGDHCRMKGVPNESIVAVANQKYSGNISALYRDMLHEKEIEFDLLCCCKFQVNKDFTTSNRDQFKRKLKF